MPGLSSGLPYLLSARQFENSPWGSKHPAALTRFLAYSRPVQSVLRFCPLAPAPALVLHRAEELCTAVAPRLAKPLSCGAGFSQFKLLLGIEFHCFLRSFMIWGFHGALRGYKRYRNAKMVGLWLWCLVRFERSSWTTNIFQVGFEQLWIADSYYELMDQHQMVIVKSVMHGTFYFSF